MRARQMLAGVGIVAIGVCASLPFQRSATPRPGEASGRPSATELQLRGPDVPEAAIGAAIAPAEARTDAGDSASSAADEEPPSKAPFPEFPRLARAPGLPRLAETFDEATETSAAPNSPAPNSAAASFPAANRPGPNRQAQAPRDAGDVLDVAAARSSTGGAADEQSNAAAPARVPVRLGMPRVNELAGSRAADRTGHRATDSWADAPLPEPPQRDLRRHRIRDGDTLPALARRYLGDAGRAAELFEANRDVLARPDVLPLGATILIPEEETTSGWKPKS